MRPTFLGPMLLLVSASCGSARSDPYRAPPSDVPEDATQNPCLTVEGMGCACGVQVGAWRCVGSMPVCVCPTPALDAGIEQDVPREDIPPAQPEDRAIPFQCPAGGTYCESIRACVDTAVNANHCGGCGRVCGVGSQCVRGACVVDAGGVDAAVDGGRPAFEQYLDRTEIWISNDGEPPRLVVGTCGRATDTSGNVYVYVPSATDPNAYAVIQPGMPAFNALVVRCGGRSYPLSTSFEISSFYDAGGRRRFNARATGTRTMAATCTVPTSIELFAFGCVAF